MHLFMSLLEEPLYLQYYALCLRLEVLKDKVYVLDGDDSVPLENISQHGQALVALVQNISDSKSALSGTG